MYLPSKNKGVIISSLVIFGCFLLSIFIIIYNHFTVTYKASLESAMYAKFQERIQLNPIDTEDHFMGNIDAPIVLVEFSDMECPFCKSLHLQIKKVLAPEIESGNLLWIYRHFPLAVHKKSIFEAEASECAYEQGGNDAFWKYLKAVYMVTPSNDGLDLDLLPKIAMDLGLDSIAFKSCLESRKYRSRIEKDIIDGARAGIIKTPSTIIWNRKNEEKEVIVGDNIRKIQSSINRQLDVNGSLKNNTLLPLPFPDSESENTCSLLGYCIKEDIPPFHK